MMESTEHTTQNPQENYNEEIILPNSDRENLNIIFIDTTVPDYQSLILGIQSDSQVVILDPTKDGITQITEILQNGKYQSVHIVSHGAEGSLQLGSAQFNSDTLSLYTQQLSQWANFLTDGADILLYGCNVASGERGEAFVQQLSQLVGADIAASDDLTGSAASGGDWDLEVATGFIEAPLAFQVGVMEAYSKVLGIFEVTNTNDSGLGSLRQAILDANATAGDDTILFTGIFTDTNPDTITLTSGELTVTEAVTLVGSGANSLTISGNNLSRIFSATAPLTIAKLKITGGNAIAGNGGAIYSNSSVIINNSTISGNTANGDGGGIWSSGNVTIANSTISGNTASSGGGVYSANNIAIANSTISGNTAKGSGGGVFGSNGTISNSTITENIADSDNDNIGDGGGVYNNGGTISVVNSIIAGNSDKGNQASDVAGSTFNGNANNLIGSVSGISSSTLGTGSDIIASDPKLAPLADNGGPTQTHALLIGSPAINAGSNTQSNPNLPTTDQRGSTRTIGNIVDIGAIESDFVPPKVNFGVATYSIAEDNNAIAVEISVTLDSIPPTDVTVPIVINSNSTATADQDYTVSSSAVTFTAGATGTELTKVFTVTIKPDTLPENDETIVFNFGALKGAVAGTITETTLTIAANDPIVYGISTTTTTPIDEGNSGTKSITLTVTRSGGTGVESTVDFALNGTATFGNDYNITVESGGTSSSGTINFAPGETQKTITVDLVGDDVYETNEDITVTLSNPQPTTAPANSTIETSAAAVTIAIVNDDAVPSVSIEDVTVNEGDTATLTVTLSNPSYQTINVSYSTSDGTATTGDDDYVTPTASTITFAPGETSKTITVVTQQDNKFELDETFKVQLTPESNATLGSKGEAVVTIENDDAVPSVSIEDVTVNEGETATLTVTLSNPSAQTINVNYSTSDGTATIGDNDYVTPTTSTITFDPGETSKTITVVTQPDSKFELDETFKVQLAPESNATLGSKGEAVVTIENDDAVPSVSIEDVTVNEGETATLTVTLSNPSAQTINVSYSISDGTATIGDNDYVTPTTSTITFAPGETSKTITVVSQQDSKFELDETFKVQLAPDSNATLGSKGEAVVTIENDDAVPSVSIEDVTVNEGETATLTVTLSNPSAQTINVSYSTSDGTATIGDNDYVTPTTSTITFDPGETSKTITVVTQPDSKFELDETFKVQLTPESNATLGSKGEAVVTIENDDAVPSVSISDDVTINEGETATLTVTLSNPSAQTINVNYSISDGTATIGDNDYVTPTTSTITFAPGETSKTITVVTQQDSKFELDETFKVQLTPESNATLGSKGEAVVTIENDDAVPSVSISDNVTINEGETATLTVTLSNPSAQTINVNYSISDGTATIGDNDYVTPTTSTITFAPGETSKTITVVSQQDSKFESDETFKVQLTPESNATLGSKGEAVVTIENDDAVPSVSIEDVTVNEGDTATLTVTLSNPSAQTINVNYSTSDGTATIGDNDYVAPTTSTITFDPGETSKTITVVTQSDSKFELDETFKVQLAPDSNATLGSKGEAVVTIENDDAVPSVSIEDVTVNEGETATLTVTLSNPSAQTINVSYSTSDGTATIGDNDYVTPTTSTITFAPGETSKTITVVSQPDSKFELDETFKVQLAPDSNATLGSKGEAVVTIENDDAVPSVSISDNVTINEGETATLTVTLSNPSAQTINVNYSISDGTATIGDNDYVTPTTSTITFAPGETSKTITVVSQQDSKFESDETFKVQLTPESNATLGSKGEAVVTIKNDDAVPSVSIEDVTVNEGDTATLTVTLSNPSAQTINVSYSISDGTATIGDNDYVTPTASTITFDPGETSKTITVVTQQDSKFELDETFKVQLAPDSNATLGSKGEAVVTIENDDAVPSVSIEDVTVNEGETATLTVTLSNPSAQTINVNYSTSDGTATIGDNDYVTPTASTITFDPGETSKTITVVTQQDSKFELDETFKVQLVPDSNATLGSKGEAVVTIKNDDAVPSVSIEDVTVNEGETATLTVTLSNPSAQTINVNYSTSDGTATIGDNDYVAHTASTITFAPGETSKTITVVTQQDNKFELDETFKVQLVPDSNATLGSKGEAVVTIENDDAVPSVSIEDVTVNEGETATLTVTLSNPSAQTINVNYSTSDGTATIGDNDYVVPTTSTITFDPGETSKTITVVSQPDSKFELDETFKVQLAPDSNATLGSKGEAVVTIENDDAVPSVSIEDVTVNEGETATLTVTLSNPSAQTINVNYSTSDGTATIGDNDYVVPTASTITFAPGETSKTITVVTQQDSKFELDETFKVQLAPESNATLGSKGEAIVTIKNDDALPSISISDDVTINEGGTATFTLTLSNPTAQFVTVNYATSDGSATSVDADYEVLNVSTLAFAPGETSKTISVVTKQDNKFEVDETFSIQFFDPSNASLTKSQATVTIANDDAPPSIKIDDVRITEGSNANFTITLSNPSSQQITVNYNTSDGSATTVDGDYEGLSGASVVFAPGETSKIISVVTKDDNIFELDETFNVNLSTSSNATFEKATGIATVTSEDLQPSISIDEVAIAGENNTATFNVTLSNPSTQQITVNYKTSNGSAIADTDYNALNDILTFAPGETTKTISVVTKDDNIFEADETFNIELFTPSNATLAKDKGLVVIISDDPKPTVSISDDVTVTEGGTATFTLTVSNPSSQPIIVNYTTSDGTATVVDNDYNAVKMGTITFAPGEMSKTIDIVTKSDKQFETDEKFNVNFSLAPESNATLSKNQAIVTVTNDDPQPTISIQNTLLKEGDTANFSVTLSNPSYEVIEVSYNTADGSATIADGDYIAGTNKLIFNPTETNKTISIATNIDAKIEDVETFSVILSEAKNATISINKGIGVINIPTILNGTSGPDLLVGTQNSDRIYGLEDNDTIIGGLGFDEIDAGDGDDTVFGDTVNSVSNSTSINSDVIKGGNGNDRIFGGDGDDWVYGEAGDDLLWGNDGQDLLWGGAGNDYLTGGQGNDRFVLASGEGTDTINDFHVGEDVIYLVNGLKLSDLSRTTFLGSTLIYENSQENSDRKILAIITGVNSSALTDSSFVVQ